MSLSRAVYSDGGASGSRYSSADPLARTAKGAPSPERRGGECDAVHLGFTWTTGTKTAMDGVVRNMGLLLSYKTEAERGRTYAPEQYKQTRSKKERGIIDLS